MNDLSIELINIQKITAGKISQIDDRVVVEEPMEIQLEYSSATGRIKKNIAVTMRTPGNDEELAIGFLFTEGIINNASAIEEAKQSSLDSNRLLVILKENSVPALTNISRNFYSTSSCGICGKASIEAIQTVTQFSQATEGLYIKASVFYPLLQKLKKEQVNFKNTGGIHASALFDLDGNFIMLREDVGRHNALDKIIGAALMKNELPLNNCILLLSGRASFELIQKATMAGILIIASIGAPSSLAVELAKESGITLIGFLKDDQFNIYAGKERITLI